MTRLTISNVGKDEVTLDSLLEDARTVSQAMSVIKLQKSTSVSGLEFVQMQFKDSDGFLDIRQFIKDGKVFSLLTTLMSSDQKEFEEINITLDTFDMTFDANIAEDLSDVDTGTGMHTFQSEDLGLEISIPAEYINITYGSSLNIFYFAVPTAEYGDSRVISISMYSSSDNHNALSWAESDLKRNKMYVNLDYFTYSELKETVIDGRTAYYYTSDININNVKNTSKDIFIEGGDYFYNISIEVSNDDKGIALMNTIQDSIKLSGADAEKMGTLIRTDDTSDIIYKEYQYDAYDITFNLPDTFEFQQQVNSASGYDMKSNMLFSIESINSSSIAQGNTVSLKELVTVNHQSLQENKNILNLSDLETKNISGKTVYIIEYDSKDTEGSMMHICEYYAESNQVYHCFAVLADTIYFGENAKNAISEFEKTLQFN